jgi:acyl-CoA thioesterase-1
MSSLTRPSPRTVGLLGGTRLVLLIAVCAAASMAAGQPPAASGQPPADSAGQLPVRPVVLVLGDSLSAAYGLPLRQGWVHLLQARIDAVGLPHRVVNASISGDTAAGGLARLPALLDEHAPRLVIVELGANDGLRGFTPAQVGRHLDAIIDKARRAGARVLLVGVRLPPNYGPAYTERFQRMYREVAARNDVALVPRLLAGVAEEPSLMQPDGLHPVAAAQPRLLENLWPTLAGLLGQDR